MAEVVLIIDDDKMVTKTLGKMLKRMGMEAKVAHSVNDGLQAIREFYPEKFRAAVIDLNLNGENGADFLQVLRQADSELPAILCTGMVSDTITKVSYRNFGFDYVLEKPFDFEKAKELFHRVISETSHRV